MNLSELLKTEIKGRKITYYLASKSDLDQIEANSRRSDTTKLLASVLFGGFLSGVITLLSGINLTQGIQNLIGLLTVVFLAAGGALLFLANKYSLETSETIKGITESGELESFGPVESEVKLTSANTTTPSDIHIGPQKEDTITNQSIVIEQTLTEPDSVLEIQEARWGTPIYAPTIKNLPNDEIEYESRWRDVTSICQNRIEDNRLKVWANVNVFGDPAEGSRKALEITYRLGDKKFTKTFHEPGMVELP